MLSDLPLSNPPVPLDKSSQEDPQDLLRLPFANWSFLNDSHVFHGVFDKSSSVDDFSKLPLVLGLKDVAVVTEGLVSLDLSNQSKKFFKLLFSNPEKSKTLQALTFVTSFKDGHVKTEETKDRIVLSGAEFCQYLEKRKALLKSAGSLQAAIEMQPSESVIFKFANHKEAIHVAKVSLYLTDFELTDSPELFQALTQGMIGPMSKMMPSAKWCMTSWVRTTIFCFIKRLAC